MSQIFVANEFHNAVLVLNDGKYFLGYGVGSVGTTSGEICFNTGMTGYQEVLTDPSYARQIITFTFPHIGNVGCNINDEEATHVFCRGVVMREQISNACNYRATEELNSWLIKHKIVGICGVDTRELTRYMVKHGACGALIYHAPLGTTIDVNDLQQQAAQVADLKGIELSGVVTTQESYVANKGLFDLKLNSYPSVSNSSAKFNVVAIDYGIKQNILCDLVESGCRVTVVPYTTSFSQIMELKPDGIFLSNGPGDPEATYLSVKDTLLALINTNIPIFGICMGHQLLALAFNLATLKMVRGHRGVNHPVKNFKTNKVEITSQNHGFCVSLNAEQTKDVEISHISLFDGSIEGISHIKKPIFSVQYHPESSPGPHDSKYLFTQFVTLMSESNNNQLNKN